ncbi:MAG: TenA family protein [Desulfovibrio sp.]|jgi:thiaminase/transcriptional activator TenA|nr:TenA family protein [Desulfovibrio sp.]
MKRKFSIRAVTAAAPIMRAIYDHPFNKEMIAGILRRNRFLYYLQQDSLRLLAFSRALAIAGGKMPDPADADLLVRLSGQGFSAEQERRSTHFREYHAKPAPREGPACMAYSKHMLERAVLGSPEEAVAALLPGFWIRRETGVYVRTLASADNFYFTWIEQYTGDAYSEIVDKIIALADRLAGRAAAKERRRMLDGFIVSSRYEYCLWDDAYFLKPWPPAPAAETMM